MIIIPAIDILKGKCVHLFDEENYKDAKVYRSDPLEVAQEYEDANLDHLHLEDLDGVKKGTVVNWDIIRELQEHTALKVDYRGGVRTNDEVSQLLDWGIHRISVEHVAHHDPQKLIRWIKTHGSHNFILSFRAQEDKVYVRGKSEKEMMTVWDFIDQFVHADLEYILCKSVQVEGATMGPNFVLYKKIKKRYPDLKIMASGGVTSLNDLKELSYIKIYGAIVGNPLYEKKISLTELRGPL